jgi:hypothetical protein
MGSPPEDEPLELAFDPRTRRAPEVSPVAPAPMIPAPAPPEPQDPSPPRGPMLPPPVGLRGHWAYTLGAWEWFRGWRGRVAAEDVAVRQACDARDAAFVALGEASLAPGNAPATSEDAEIAAFAATLSRFAAEAEVLTTRRTQSLDAAARATADTTRAIAGFETRLSALRAEYRPHETELRLLEQRLDDTRRQLNAVSAREAKGGDPRAAADRDRFETARIALEAQVAERQRAVEAGRRQVEALEHEQTLVQKAGAQEIALLEGRAKQASEEVERLAERRRAALMDLGHEVLRRGLVLPGGTEETLRARTALEALETARSHREGVLAERREIDLAPCIRTLAVAAMLAVGLALLVVFV